MAPRGVAFLCVAQPRVRAARASARPARETDHLGFGTCRHPTRDTPVSCLPARRAGGRHIQTEPRPRPRRHPHRLGRLRRRRTTVPPTVPRTDRAAPQLSATQRTGFGLGKPSHPRAPGLLNRQMGVRVSPGVCPGAERSRPRASMTATMQSGRPACRPRDRGHAAGSRRTAPGSRAGCAVSPCLPG